MIRVVARKGGDEENGVMLIRAVQGHSNRIVQTDDLMEVLTVQHELPVSCVHGTFHKHLDSVLTTGLQTQGDRIHIHFAVTDAYIRSDL
jgi:RNA:NAD 2'-phosphotransferase (TPT1/KptA family)